jgi:hypothetical protein
LPCDATNKLYDAVFRGFSYGKTDGPHDRVDIFLIHEDGATAMEVTGVPLAQRDWHSLDRFHKLRKVFGGNVGYTLIPDFHSDAEHYRDMQQKIEL